MIPELYRFISENRERIISTALSLTNDEIKRAVKEYWLEYRPSPNAVEQVGIDSGWNAAPFHGFYFYAVDAAAVNLNGELTGAMYESWVSTMEVRDGDKVSHNPNLFLESRGMEFEKELAESSNADLVMLDGSVLARYYNRREGRVEENMGRLVRGLMERGNIIFVAKYSSSNSLFKGPVGDMFYVHHLTSSTGFTAPSMISELNLGFVYARLAEDSPVIRIEFPGDLSEQEIRAMLDALSYRAIKGYPYVLLEAHRRCKVSNDEMAKLIRLAGLSYEGGGREALWE